MTAPTRRAIDLRAGGLLVFLCAIWGGTHVAGKLAAPDVPLVLQAGLRSAIAGLLLFAWARVRRIPLFRADGTLAAGLLAGALFAGEFLFLFSGLAHTAASRMVVFLYLAPVFTAVGVHLFVPGEQLRSGQWLGVALAFGGIAVAFGDGFLGARGTALGDTFGVVAALMWAATTVWIRASRLTHASAAKVLFYQLAVSAPVLLAASHLLGEPGTVRFTAVAITSLVYQGAIVAFASYLAWFWLLTRYRAANLAVFGFLTPLFGVVAGVTLLGEPVSPLFAASILLVAFGILLVNRRA
ncbi:MAG: EamA family transporter [Betaproteobacteria bacterium]|nr:EamA family transporter [Betaproteobacteria bacterium]